MQSIIWYPEKDLCLCFLYNVNNDELGFALNPIVSCQCWVNKLWAKDSPALIERGSMHVTSLTKYVHNIRSMTLGPNPTPSSSASQVIRIDEIGFNKDTVGSLFQGNPQVLYIPVLTPPIPFLIFSPPPRSHLVTADDVSCSSFFSLTYAWWNLYSFLCRSVPTVEGLFIGIEIRAWKKGLAEEGTVWCTAGYKTREEGDFTCMCGWQPETVRIPYSMMPRKENGLSIISYCG